MLIYCEADVFPILSHLFSEVLKLSHTYFCFNVIVGANLSRGQPYPEHEFIMQEHLHLCLSVGRCLLF